MLVVLSKGFVLSSCDVSLVRFLSCCEFVRDWWDECELINEFGVSGSSDGGAHGGGFGSRPPCNIGLVDDRIAVAEGLGVMVGSLIGAELVPSLRDAGRVRRMARMMREYVVGVVESGAVSLIDGLGGDVRVIDAVNGFDAAVGRFERRLGMDQAPVNSDKIGGAVIEWVARSVAVDVLRTLFAVDVKPGTLRQWIARGHVRVDEAGRVNIGDVLKRVRG